MSAEEANVLIVREIFARFDARAMLPCLREAFEEWRPDLVLRDPNEYSSAVAADLYGVPRARVGINLAAVEEGALDIAAETVDELRRSAGLSGDREGERIRQSPYLTVFPASLEAAPRLFGAVGTSGRTRCVSRRRWRGRGSSTAITTL